jgi:glycine cleavage system H protein
MPNIPDELKYSDQHEWVAGTVAEGETVTVGVTEYATSALGDIVYVEAPAIGDVVTAGAACGELESTKAVSEFYSPVAGEVVAVNPALADNPEIVNKDPYGEGWIAKIKVSKANKNLLDAEQYAAITE